MSDEIKISEVRLKYLLAIKKAAEEFAFSRYTEENSLEEMNNLFRLQRVILSGLPDNECDVPSTKDE